VARSRLSILILAYPKAAIKDLHSEIYIGHQVADVDGVQHPTRSQPSTCFEAAVRFPPKQHQQQSAMIQQRFELLNRYRIAKQICALTHSALRMDGDNRINE
jgi:hypothetical protein